MFSISIRKSLRYLATCSLLFFILLMGRIVWPYTSGALDIDFLLTKQFYIHLSHYRWSFYLHIFSSLFILVAGLTQFSSRILKNAPSIHRWIGKGYVFAVLVVSAPAALIMSFYANGGSIAKLSFILLCILWWLFTYKGYATIRKGNVTAHKVWMIRSFALALSAITLRLIQLLVASFTDWDYEAFYTWNAWISWLLNLTMVELYINGSKLKFNDQLVSQQS